MECCSICELEKKLVTHHLSYNPEITMPLCQNCHLTMHRIARLIPDKQDVLFGIVKQYGNQWENGHEKHIKTEHCRKKARERYKHRTDESKNRRKEYRKTDRAKEYHKEYCKTDRYKEYNKKYHRGYRFKKLTPEKQMEYLSKVSRIVSTA